MRVIFSLACFDLALDMLNNALEPSSAALGTIVAPAWLWLMGFVTWVGWTLFAIFGDYRKR